MSSSSDEEIARKDFDPLKLLYGATKASKEQVCLFDNLASLVGYYKRSGENLEEKFDKSKKSQTQPKKVPLLRGEVMERRFLPHQQMIQVEPKKGRVKNVLTRMEDAQGPMAQLFDFVRDRTRVRVLIRKNHGIRGEVTGVLRLFDRHWNLVVTDVEERYQRRKLRYGNEVCADTVAETKARRRLQELGLRDPMQGALIRPVDKKRVEIKRKHDILVIRGEQVAVVSRDIQGEAKKS